MRASASRIVAKRAAVAAALAAVFLSSSSAEIGLAWAGPQEAVDEDVRIIPNFSSIKYGWLAIDDELKPMMSGARPVRADPAFPYFGNQNGTQPTLRVSDLNSPILTEWSKKRMAPSNEETKKGVFPYSFQARCMP